ncbi:choline/carnitine O-acyltransferase [Neisseria musculi]|uniref:Choline/Carnitine o-acyltransferase family protein n=1 Tax=Neisseria musculi TaxID=1815583 RepID=A0A7H1MA25_9NEIS|nr:choline/carnitine O-acyltransferase [Neisseria musculi]QNT58490.1 choline/Carnitine o-acyltransferase family protein [Neisseria musculi]
MPQQPVLPVPDLAETCARYLKQVKPLLNDEDYAATAAAVRQFQTRSAPGLQAGLQAFAAETDRSWLIDAWLESYLKIRTPLPLASNVGFHIRTLGRDLGGWAAALAGVCADYHHGRISAPQTPQGAPVCMAQWQILRGAARVPQTGCDTFRIAETPSRHIGVLHNGFYYRIAALDENDEAYHPDTFRQAVAQILADSAENPFPVVVPCYPGGNQTARVYKALRSKEENAELADYLETDLFHISIYREESLNADEDLAYATFAKQQNIWCYKPTTFCYNTATERLFLHCEHTWEDGGTLKGIVALAAEKNGGKGRKAAPAISRHAWHLTPAQKKSWPQWQQNYAAQARKMRVKSVVIPFDGGSIPKGTSHDALMQFLLQYAQLTTYGDIRNTYEAVDVSHFAYGRTECVRPVSEESLAFVASLLQEKPAQSLLDAALAEHKARIKAAKTGQGANRHLLGLQLAAKRKNSHVPAFFKSTGYQTFSTDFLSTSTLGDDAVIINFAFAPTSPDGLGINYTLAQEGWLFTVSYPETQEREVAIFIEALKQGGSRLLVFFNPLPKEH